MLNHFETIGFGHDCGVLRAIELLGRAVMRGVAACNLPSAICD
jgi:hypothetical protein